jgi:uracil phosphoribosyltransferase
MAFNSSNYIKDADKTFTSRITDPLVKTASYGMPTGATNIAGSTVDSMLSTGSTAAAAAQLATARTDSAIAGGDDEYYAIAGKDPTRAARVSLQKLRRKDISTKEFINNVNPQTKIAAYKSDNTIEIISVL